MSENKRHRLAGISENHKKESIEKIEDTGKEKGITLETPRTEEQKVSVKKEGDGTEAPKKKKNIIRVYHAQNASDGGKNRKKAPGERRQRPQGTAAGTRPAAPAAKAEAPAKPQVAPAAKAEAPAKPQAAPAAKAEAPAKPQAAPAVKAEAPAKPQAAPAAKAEAPAKPQAAKAEAPAKPQAAPAAKAEALTAPGK